MAKKPVKNVPFNYKRFATCIWAKREKDNLTTQQVSDETGLPKSTINRAEAIAKELSMNTIIAICNWLDKPVQFFLTPLSKDNVKGDKSKGTNSEI